MKIAVIGCKELFHVISQRLFEVIHQIVCIFIAKEAFKNTRTFADIRWLAGPWQIPFAFSEGVGLHTDFLRDAWADIAETINFTGAVPQFVLYPFPSALIYIYSLKIT